MSYSVRATHLARPARPRLWSVCLVHPPYYYCTPPHTSEKHTHRANVLPGLWSHSLATVRAAPLLDRLHTQTTPQTTPKPTYSRRLFERPEPLSSPPHAKARSCATRECHPSLHHFRRRHRQCSWRAFPRRLSRRRASPLSGAPSPWTGGAKQRGWPRGPCTLRRPVLGGQGHCVPHATPAVFGARGCRHSLWSHRCRGEELSQAGAGPLLTRPCALNAFL